MNRPVLVADTHDADVQYRLDHDPAYRAMIYSAQSMAWYHERAWRRGLRHGGDVEHARRELLLSFEGETDYLEQLGAEQRAAATVWTHGSDRSVFAAMTDPIPLTPAEAGDVPLDEGDGVTAGDAPTPPPAPRP